MHSAMRSGILAEFSLIATNPAIGEVGGGGGKGGGCEMNYLPPARPSSPELPLGKNTPCKQNNERRSFSSRIVHAFSMATP